MTEEGLERRERATITGERREGTKGIGTTA